MKVSTTPYYPKQTFFSSTVTIIIVKIIITIKVTHLYHSLAYYVPDIKIGAFVVYFIKSLQHSDELGIIFIPIVQK